MIHNRTDFYFENGKQWTTYTMPRLIALVDAWLSCKVKVHREGFQLMAALSHCRGINNKYVTIATSDIERYLNTIMRHNRDIERSWRRDPVNPQPGPVLICQFPSDELDENGCLVDTNRETITPSSDEQTTAMLAQHYLEMRAILVSDPRAHADDINRAATLAILYGNTEQETEQNPVTVPCESLQVITDEQPRPTHRRRSRKSNKL